MTSPSMLYNDGKFYHGGGVIVDAATGKVLTGKFTKGRSGDTPAVPGTGHLLCLANGHVYGFTRPKTSKKDREKMIRKGICTVFTADGEHVAANPVVRSEPTSEQKAMLRACINRDEDSGFSRGYTFTFAGSKIYFRGYTSIVCIGE